MGLLSCWHIDYDMRVSPQEFTTDGNNDWRKRMPADLVEVFVPELCLQQNHSAETISQMSPECQSAGACNQKPDG